ncbi:MAG: menaquinone biosynthesis protein [Acidobacteria bacterium]|nr:menaquinone biosynthesis protein [Acidobacteriota bacterium]
MFCEIGVVALATKIIVIPRGDTRFTVVKLRLSFIHFVNAFPLQWGFMRGGLGKLFEISYDLPALCADRLASGDADVGLIPAIEYQRIPGLRVIPHLAIASKKQVESVLFVSKKPIHEVKTVALDTSSRTSVILIRLLLRRKFFLHPEYRPAAPNLEAMLRENDSALMIGNPALLVDRNRYRVLDLVEQWVEFTGRPFVFAFWAVREGVKIEPYVHSFVESKAYGLSHVDEIADYSVSQVSVSRRLILDYLEDKLNYDLDRENLEGLDLFYRMAASEGLISSLSPVRFVESVSEHRLR